MDENDPLALDAMTSLAQTYKEQGRLKGAKKLAAEVYDGTKSITSGINKEKLVIMDVLGCIYLATRNYKDAEASYA